ncbi:MAG: Asp23/Gls24 family envelope stress response protein, partial [Clostridia bacterium]|nr:Asp23/Gls24 family envelope stress response protein [Clostridia bacterium]
VIPAPTVEVKKSFPETWIDPFKIFVKHNQQTQITRSWQEQSIVRPTFTSYGNISISHSALVSIVNLASLEIAEVRKTGKIHLEKKEDKVSISLQVKLPYGRNLVALAQEVQKVIRYKVELMTSLLVEKIDLTISGLYFPSV